MLTEKMTVNTKKSDEDIFNYNSLIEGKWKNVIDSAKRFQKIYFDLENDDTTKQKKRIYIPKKLRKDQPVKYEINAELFTAGGDWEFPVYYFRIELTHDYNLRNIKYRKNPKYVWDLDSEYNDMSNKYVIIPPESAGNSIKFDGKEWHAYTDEDDEYKDLKLNTTDERNLWKWLTTYLETAVNDRHEMLDEVKIIKLKNLLERTDKIKLTSSEYNEVKKKFGMNRGCSFAKDKNGYYCYTHRARSKSYKTINDIPKKDYNFICSTS